MRDPLQPSNQAHAQPGMTERSEPTRTDTRRSGASRGHSLTEYAIGLCLVVMGLVFVLTALQHAVEGYHDQQASWLSMPFP